MSDPSLFDVEPDEPQRPYFQEGERSAGWSGTDTSKEGERRRALTQKPVYRYVQQHGARGATRAEIARHFNNDGGAVSGSLTVLHQTGLLARLVEKRGKHHVYVIPSQVGDRETEAPVKRVTRRELAYNAFAAGWVRGNNGSSDTPDEGFDQWWEQTNG